MIGHYFGLYTTHETQFGAELVDGSNCETTGDLMCDTDADPQGGSIGNCTMIDPTDSQDANGQFYTPPTCNIMGWYTNTCDKKFTVDQYNRMLEIMKTGRKYLW